MSILVTGGAGYIGSHMTLALLDQGEDVVVLDNLSIGIRALVPDAAFFVEGTIADYSFVRSVIAAATIAGSISNRSLALRSNRRTCAPRKLAAPSSGS